MVVRVVELLTHIHNDDIRQDGGPLAEYSCLGYFDALHMESFEYDVQGEKLNIYETVEKKTIKNIDGRCTRKTLICINKNKSKEEEFWQKTEEDNLLFVSVVRLKTSEKGNTASIVDKFDRRPSTIAYLTYDASELVIFMSTNSYESGMQFVVSLHDEISIYRVFTVMAIKERFKENKVDETVRCRLRASVRAREEVDVWMKELEDTLACKCERFHTLGEKDLLIEINDISLNKVLPLYLGNELLSHGNEQFRKTFFEMQSEFLEVVER